MVLTRLLIVVFSVILLTVIYLKWKFTYWKRRGVPALPAQIPFGNLTDVALSKIPFVDLYRKLYHTYKSLGYKYVGYYLLTTPVLVVLDPQIIKMVMVQNFSHFTDHTFYIDEKRDPYSVNLFALKGKNWKAIREKLTPAFTSGKMKMMFQNFVEISNRLKTVLDGIADQSQAVNVNELIGKYTTDVTGNCIFGFDCNSLQGRDDDLRKHLKFILGGTVFAQLKFFFGFFWHGFFRLFNVNFMSPVVQEHFTNLVSSIIQQREEKNVVRKDFMQLFVNLRNNKSIEHDSKLSGDDNSEDKSSASKSLSITDIASHSLFFYTAGYETSMVTTSFFLYEIVSNGEVYNKLKEEIESVLGNHDGEITYDSIHEMTYLDQCLSETLRKYPTLPFFVRECTKDLELADSFVIKKGSQIHIPIIEIQADSEYFPEPEKFDPERFSETNKHNIRQYTYFPFGEGPRMCMGMRLAQIQIKVAVVTMMKNFELSLNYKTQIPLKMDDKNIIPTVVGGIWLNVQKISIDKR